MIFKNSQSYSMYYLHFVIKVCFVILLWVYVITLILALQEGWFSGDELTGTERTEWTVNMVGTN